MSVVDCCKEGSDSSMMDALLESVQQEEEQEQRQRQGACEHHEQEQQYDSDDFMTSSLASATIDQLPPVRDVEDLIRKWEHHENVNKNSSGSSSTSPQQQQQQSKPSQQQLAQRMIPAPPFSPSQTPCRQTPALSPTTFVSLSPDRGKHSACRGGAGAATAMAVSPTRRGLNSMNADSDSVTVMTSTSAASAGDGADSSFVCRRQSNAGGRAPPGTDRRRPGSASCDSSLSGCPPTGAGAAAGTTNETAATSSRGTSLEDVPMETDVAASPPSLSPLSSRQQISLKRQRTTSPPGGSGNGGGSSSASTTSNLVRRAVSNSPNMMMSAPPQTSAGMENLIPRSTTSVSSIAASIEEATTTIIADHDVVLGDTHTPTTGTMIYRQVRQRFAKKNISNQELAVLKDELHQRLQVEMKSRETHQVCPVPRFWYSMKNKSKVQPNSIKGYLLSSGKTRRGRAAVNTKRGAYGLATDASIKEDVKSAPKASRSRGRFVFNLKKGSLQDVVSKAQSQTQQWVGHDAEKEIFAKGFQEDLERLLPWLSSVDSKKVEAGQRALEDPSMKRTHMREAQIHSIHSEQLEDALVELVNRLGNAMIDRHRRAQRKNAAVADFDLDTCSVERSAAKVDDDEETKDDDNASRNTASVTGAGRPPLPGWQARASAVRSSGRSSVGPGDVSGDASVGGVSHATSASGVSSVPGRRTAASLCAEDMSDAGSESQATPRGRFNASGSVSTVTQNFGPDQQDALSDSPAVVSTATKDTRTRFSSSRSLSALGVVNERSVIDPHSAQDLVMEEHLHKRTPKGLSIMFTQLMQISSEVRPKKKEIKNAVDVTPCSVPGEIRSRMIMEDDESISSIDEDEINFDHCNFVVSGITNMTRSASDNASTSSLRGGATGEDVASGVGVNQQDDSVVSGVARGANERDNNNNLEELLQYHQMVLNTRLSMLGENHADTAKSYCNIGLVLCKLGEWDEALTHHRIALKIREAVLGPWHLETAKSYSSVGLSLSKKCVWDEALVYHRKALEIREGVLGNRHSDTAKSYRSIGFVLSKKSDWVEALRYHRMALEVQEAVTGKCNDAQRQEGQQEKKQQASVPHNQNSNDTTVNDSTSFGSVRASWQQRVGRVPSKV